MQTRAPASTALKPVNAADEDDDVEEAPPRRRRGYFRAAIIVVALLAGAGGGWVAWKYRDDLPTLPGLAAISGVVAAISGPSMSPELFRMSPFASSGDTPDDIEAGLQKGALWRILKRDSVEFYKTVVDQVAGMRAQKADDRGVSKFLADAVVTHRRQNAKIALAGSPTHLRQIAQSFLANLKQLAARDTQTCYSFISFGEANSFIIELSRTPTFGEPLHRQLTSIFEAVADGRKAPQTYTGAGRADYDALTAELTTRGWSQDDLMTFSDPRKLSSATPDVVCRMVQDWFGAHLALKDADMQARLLGESLRPLVHG